MRCDTVEQPLRKLRNEHAFVENERVVVNRPGSRKDIDIILSLLSIVTMARTNDRIIYAQAYRPADPSHIYIPDLLLSWQLSSLDPNFLKQVLPYGHHEAL